MHTFLIKEQTNKQTSKQTNKQNVLNILYMSCPFLKFVVPESLNFVEVNANNDIFLETVSWYVIRMERFHQGLHHLRYIRDFQKKKIDTYAISRNVSRTSWLRSRNNHLRFYFEVMEAVDKSCDYFSESG
jgi:hypothetical protein